MPEANEMGAGSRAAAALQVCTGGGRSRKRGPVYAAGLGKRDETRRIWGKLGVMKQRYVRLRRALPQSRPIWAKGFPRWETTETKEGQRASRDDRSEARCPSVF